MAKSRREAASIPRSKSRQAGEPAKKAGSRITRLLTDHSEKLAKFEAFMGQINREIKDRSQQA